MSIDDKIRAEIANLDVTDFWLAYYQSEYKKMLLANYDFSKVPEDRITEIIYPSSWYYINDVESSNQTSSLNEYLRSL